MQSSESTGTDQDDVTMMHLFYHPAMLEHDTGAGHPERADRLRAIREKLTGERTPEVQWVEPRPVELAWVESVHDPAYVEHIESLAGESESLDPDTRVSPGSVEAAHLAAGGVLDAVEAVADGEADTAFALVRPPGHHAEYDEAMGFCLYNNVAVAAEYVREELGAERILVVDWDVHHGNGTQNLFFDRDDVLYVSIHQSPLFPGTGDIGETGVGGGEGRTLNVPFPGGMGDADYRQAFERLLLPVARQYEPEFVLVSAGYDAHVRDPLAGMNVSAEGFGWMAQALCEVAADVADDNIVFTLEGGYDLQGLSESVAATVAAATARRSFQISGQPSKRGLNRLQRVIDRQGAFWKLD